MIDACDLLLLWNREVQTAQEYYQSPEGMQKMAASCMIIESIGEGVKRLDKVAPNLLAECAPEIPWKSVKGLRDHIAHGYFDIDGDIIFDIISNEIVPLKSALGRALDNLDNMVVG
ncbi:MAG: DUF86 domain-containing protein [Muribaculaceae bacterium]